MSARIRIQVLISDLFLKFTAGSRQFLLKIEKSDAVKEFDLNIFLY